MHHEDVNGADRSSSNTTLLGQTEFTFEQPVPMDDDAKLIPLTPSVNIRSKTSAYKDGGKRQR
jgi:hypothetical protein